MVSITEFLPSDITLEGDELLTETPCAAWMAKQFAAAKAENLSLAVLIFNCGNQITDDDSGFVRRVDDCCHLDDEVDDNYYFGGEGAPVG